MHMINFHSDLFYYFYWPKRSESLTYICHINQLHEYLWMFSIFAAWINSAKSAIMHSTLLDNQGLPKELHVCYFLCAWCSTITLSFMKPGTYTFYVIIYFVLIFLLLPNWHLKDPQKNEAKEEITFLLRFIYLHWVVNHRFKFKLSLRGQIVWK